MDGRQRSMNHSLQYRLSLWLSLAILGTAVAAGAFSFIAAYREANEFQDDQLRQVAALIDPHHLPLPQEQRGGVNIADAESRMVVQLLPPERPALAAAPAGDIQLPPTLSAGMQTVTVNDQSWRVFAQRIVPGKQIAVAQQTAVRDELARDSALRTVMPFIILIPLLLLVVGVLIRRMFIPVRILALDLDSRSEQQLGALSEHHLPREILPFVVAINRLLARVERAVAEQRRFVADAAHELRSPLTALSLQAERLSAADMSDTARARLEILKNGMRRTLLLLQQLLTLARVQQTSELLEERASLRHVIRLVLEDMIPLAERKHIDIGMTGPEDASVAAAPVELQIMVKNLVDNAIRYTPAHGRIDLSVTTSDSAVILQIQDDGPGIAEAERVRVFDPFYRVLGGDEIGSGLGLSIVKTLADRLGATVALHDAQPQPPHGLRIVVTFPASPAASAASIPR